MSVGAWSAEHGHPWISAAEYRKSSGGLVTLTMGNTLSYFTGGDKQTAASVGVMGGAPSALRRPAAESASAPDTRGRRPSDNEEDVFHDTASSFSSDILSPRRAVQKSDASVVGANANGAGETRSAAAQPPPFALSTHQGRSADGLRRSAEQYVDQLRYSNNNSSVKDSRSSSGSSKGSGVAAGADRGTDRGTLALGGDSTDSFRGSGQQLKSYQRESTAGGTNVAPRTEQRCSVGRPASFTPPNVAATPRGGAERSSLAQGCLSGCAPSQVGVDKELTNIICSAEKLSPKANTASPLKICRAAAFAESNQADLAAELKSAIEARVQRSASVKNQKVPVAAHCHRRTNSLTHLEVASPAANGSQEPADGDARTRDRRARLQNLERRREKLLSEVRGVGEVASVTEDLYVDESANS